MSRSKAIMVFMVLVTLLSGLIYLAYMQRHALGSLLPKAEIVQPGYYKVAEVYDGDTFAVEMSGKLEKIRLIGIDTPETHKPGAPVQCFGPEASAFTKNILATQHVRLEADPIGNNRDRYDRLLRYAYLPDGTLLNQQLIQEGFGFAYLTFQFQKQAEFSEAQAGAESTKKGLWASCKTTAKNGRWQTNDQGK